MNEKQKLLVLIGPTAVGKTNLSIQLAKKYNGEIISGDSMQIYRGMDIGTAKIKPSEMEGIPHYLIDIKEPDEAFSAAEFQAFVRQQISEITSRGKLPIIVGGTGLYIQSVIYDYQFSDAPSDEGFRRELEKRAEIEGNDVIYEELKKIDSISAENIHPNNVRRVIRAIEVYHCTGLPVSKWQEKQQPQFIYDTALIGLTMDRELLYQRINQRVDLMMQEGLLEEVRSLYERGIRDCPSIQAIGYKEIYDYIEGRAELQTAIENLKQNSRRYAKRQLTWFRNKMDVEWYDMSKAIAEEQWQKKFDEICFHIEGKLRVKSNTYY